MHETLQILLKEGRAYARNGDAVAVTELKHRVVVRIGRDRRGQFLHIMNVGEVAELDRVVLRISKLLTVCVPSPVEHECTDAGAADRD